MSTSFGSGFSRLRPDIPPKAGNRNEFLSLLARQIADYLRILMDDSRKSFQSGSSEQVSEASQGNKVRVAVPSFFTLMNMFCGFVAITQVHQEQFAYACYLIIFAGLFDLLDGIVARLMHGTSQFGVELDSLCDAVSFGVAPAYLVYARILESSGTFGLIVSTLPVMCGAVRLARFNLQTLPEKKLDFDGLPISIYAYFVVAIVLNIDQETWLVQSGVLDTGFFIPVVVILSLLMVSMIRFDGVPRISFDYLRQYPVASGAYIASVLFMAIFPYSGLLLTILVYILIGLAHASIRSVRSLMALSGREE